MALDGTSLLLYLFIGLIAGWLADIVVKGVSFGLLGDLIAGIVGALIGGFVFGMLGIGTTSILGSLIAAFVGAVILLSLIRLVRYQP